MNAEQDTTTWEVLDLIFPCTQEIITLAPGASREYDFALSRDLPFGSGTQLVDGAYRLVVQVGFGSDSQYLKAGTFEIEMPPSQ